MVRFFYWLFGSITLGAILALGIVGGTLWYFSHDLPDHKQLKNYQPGVTTRVYASNGNLVGEFAIENRLFTPIVKIPPLVIDAFLSAEDKNFYQHPGIDFMDMIRAAFKAAQEMGSGKRMQGASTITQQVATNFLLNRQQSLSYKIKQIMVAFRLEQTFTKDEILELYLNEIYMGRGTYGVASAALNYFDKALDELTVDEAAFLAALPKAPSRFDPDEYYDRVFARRNWVIDRMVEDGRITAKEGEEAKKKPIKTVGRNPFDFEPSAFFVEDVRRELLKKYGMTGLYKGGLSVRTTLDPKLQAIADKALRQGLINFDRHRGGGWRGAVARFSKSAPPKGNRYPAPAYYGALDPDNWVEQLNKVPDPGGLKPWVLGLILNFEKGGAVVGLKDGSKGFIAGKDLSFGRGGRYPIIVGDVIPVELLTDDEKGNPPDGMKSYALRQLPEISGAVVIMDPHTGRVYALSGGYSYDMGEFNRATQAYRQPGSSFKPFVYLAALNNGYTPSSIVVDGPFSHSPGKGLPVWSPRNYGGDYIGPATLMKGIALSRNVMTVRLAHTLGMEKVVQTSLDFGIYDHLAPYLPMAIGAGETTPLRLVTAYAQIANGGKKITPTLIDRIQDRRGKTIFKHDERQCEGCDDNFAGQDMPKVTEEIKYVTDPRTAYQMIFMLEGVVQRGTATRLKDLDRPLAGKTGTTNDAKDVWFIGFTPDLVVGCYIGYDQPRNMGRATGGQVAAPIVKEIFKEALVDVPPKDFHVPNGLVFAKNSNLLVPYLPGTEPGSGGGVEYVGYGGEGSGDYSQSGGYYGGNYYGNNGGGYYQPPAAGGYYPPQPPSGSYYGGGGGIPMPITEDPGTYYGYEPYGAGVY